jgi:hypothetical protein
MDADTKLVPCVMIGDDPRSPERRDSPAQCIGTIPTVVNG